MSTRNDLMVLGRTIGTYDGWDGDFLETLIFYAFKPCKLLEKELPEGDLTVNYEKGNFIYFKDDGGIDKTIDMMHILNMIKKDET